MRSRILRAFRTKSRMLIWPFPSRFGVCFPVMTCCCWRRSSAASNGDDPFRIGNESRQHVKQSRLTASGTSGHHYIHSPLHTLLKGRHIKGQRVEAKQIFMVKGFFENFLIVITGLFRDTGLMTILTLEPSWSLASTIGEASSRGGLRKQRFCLLH